MRNICLLICQEIFLLLLITWSLNAVLQTLSIMVCGKLLNFKKPSNLFLAASWAELQFSCENNTPIVWTVISVTITIFVTRRQTKRYLVSDDPATRQLLYPRKTRLVISYNNKLQSLWQQVTTILPPKNISWLRPWCLTWYISWTMI